MNKTKAVDTSGNTVECVTLGQAAKTLGMSNEHLRLQLYKNRMIPFYKVIGKSGRRLIRIKKKDLDDFFVDQEIYNRIADKIKIARSEYVQVVEGISQTDLAKGVKVTPVYLNYVENKKQRVSIKLLDKIAKFLGKDLGWFLT
jgi:excisionase family DNA binding protein